MARIAVLVIMIWLLILCQITVLVIADGDNFSSAYFETRENRWLAGHLVKMIESTAIMSCNRECLRSSWCTSTNFKESVGQGDKGTCELNKHEFAIIDDDSMLINQPGTTFTMMLKGCLMAGCLNGGSCLFDKKKETFTCSCKLPWIGDKCVLKRVCQAVGVADINVIPDNRMTASTYFDDGHYPFYGRLNGTRGDGAWGPKTGSNKTDYLQVDMGAVYSVCAVETQGEWSGDYWTKSFKLQFSSDNATWQSYKEHNTEKVFNGSKNRDGIVRNPFNTDVQARYVRFYPVTYYSSPCMRVEIYARK